VSTSRLRSPDDWGSGLVDDESIHVHPALDLERVRVAHPRQDLDLDGAAQSLPLDGDQDRPGANRLHPDPSHGVGPPPQERLLRLTLPHREDPDFHVRGRSPVPPVKDQVQGSVLGFRTIWSNR
jgi:hypothetical protein